MSETSDYAVEMRERPPGISPGPTAIMVRKYNVKRSCIRCHERKVRCNKDTPCIACVRSDVQCRYPGPERAKRVKSRSQKGLGAFAATTANAKAQDNGSTRDQAPTAPQTPSPPSGSAVVGQLGVTRHAPSEPDQSSGFLLKEGSSTRYVNEFTFSRVLEKVREVSISVLRWTKAASWY